MTRHAPRIGALALSVVLALAATARGGPSLDAITLADVDGRAVAPFAARDAKAVVVLFTRADCPISNRYAPEVGRLFERFGSRGVRFWLVYCDPDESAADIREHLSAYGYAMGALRDSEHALVRAAGATVTPEAAVFVPAPEGWRMVYRGRIDDRYVAIGTARPEPTTRDLADVLEAIGRGETPAPTTTTAVGCFISDLR